MSESIEQPSKYIVYTMTGAEKTAFLRSLVYAGATEPLVRQTAVGVVKGLGRDEHWERLVRLHRFVRDSVPYHREPVEMFYRPSDTLVHGADCDDHVILLCSMAWSMRYPFIVEALGDPDAPNHYTCRLGWPPNDEPTGDEHTRWASFETTVDALPGEHVNDALRRMGS
jgi:hypothetical protein